MVNRSVLSRANKGAARVKRKARIKCRKFIAGPLDIHPCGKRDNGDLSFLPDEQATVINRVARCDIKGDETFTLDANSRRNFHSTRALQVSL
jgi:hypothetical protein